MALRVRMNMLVQVPAFLPALLRHPAGRCPFFECLSVSGQLGLSALQEPGSIGAAAGVSESHQAHHITSGTSHSMHLRAITFDRVFSIYRKTSKIGDYTEFGFQAGETTVYKARVFGHPQVLTGVPLLVALPKSNSWKNIYGWKNQMTGEVIVHEPSTWDAVVGVAATVFLLCMTGLFLIDSVKTIGWAACCAIATIGLVTVVALGHSAMRSIGKLQAYGQLRKSKTGRSAL